MIELIKADKSTDNYTGAVFDEFGLSVDKHYDVLVVAPGWTPIKIMNDYDVEITCTAEHSYISRYEVVGGRLPVGLDTNQLWSKQLDRYSIVMCST